MQVWTGSTTSISYTAITLSLVPTSSTRPLNRWCCWLLIIFTRVLKVWPFSFNLFISLSYSFSLSFTFPYIQHNYEVKTADFFFSRFFFTFCKHTVPKLVRDDEIWAMMWHNFLKIKWHRTFFRRDLKPFSTVWVQKRFIKIGACMTKKRFGWKWKKEVKI